MKFVNPKNDIAFKKIFGNENKKEILISLLNAVLDLKGVKEIQTIEILNPYQVPHLIDFKQSTLDVRAKDKRGITFIVEMHAPISPGQVERKSYLRKRFAYYVAKEYVSQIESGADYPKLNQVIFIGVFDFNEFNNEHFLSSHLILNCETLEQELSEVEFNFIELPKFTKKETELRTILDKWVYFIKHADDLEIVPEHAASMPALRAAYDVANRLNWSKQELDVMEYWEMRERGELDKREAAFEKGEQNKAQEIARNLLAEGLDPGIVAKTTGISPDDLATL